MRFRHALALALLVVAVACSGPKAPSQRPANVPVDAKRLPGPNESHVWVKCRHDAKEVALYQCSIWDEFQGKVWKEGAFELRRPFQDRATAERRYQKATVAPSPFVIERYDGEQLFLAERYLLVPLAK